jgi:periplasmic protein CpxP/Spy
MRFSMAALGARTPRVIGVLALTLALAAGIGTAAFAHSGPWERGGIGMHHGRAGNRMLDLAGATPEQRTQIEQIMQSARADMKPLRASGQTLRQQTRALLAQPTIDANAAEALRQQELALHDQVSKRLLQALIAAANVLTPEQRQTLATQIAERQDLMARHRAEWEALEHGSK